jgi:hypothetical protein
VISLAHGESVNILLTSSLDHCVESLDFQKSDANRATAHREPANASCKKGFRCISLRDAPRGASVTLNSSMVPLAFVKFCKHRGRARLTGSVFLSLTGAPADTSLETIVST